MATLLTLLTFVSVGQEVRRCKQMEAGVGKGIFRGTFRSVEGLFQGLE